MSANINLPNPILKELDAMHWVRPGFTASGTSHPVEFMHMEIEPLILARGKGSNIPFQTIVSNIESLLHKSGAECAPWSADLIVALISILRTISRSNSSEDILAILISKLTLKCTATHVRVLRNDFASSGTDINSPNLSTGPYTFTSFRDEVISSKLCDVEKSGFFSSLQLSSLHGGLTLKSTTTLQAIPWIHTAAHLCTENSRILEKDGHAKNSLNHIYNEFYFRLHGVIEHFDNERLLKYISMSGLKKTSGLYDAFKCGSRCVSADFVIFSAQPTASAHPHRGFTWLSHIFYEANEISRSHFKRGQIHKLLLEEAAEMHANLKELWDLDPNEIDISDHPLADRFYARIGAATSLLTSGQSVYEQQNSMCSFFLENMIALEILFGEKRNTTKTLSRRIAALVALNYNESQPLIRERFRNEVADLENMYNTRSRYVHDGGRITEKDCINIASVVHKTAKCLVSWCRGRPGSDPRGDAHKTWLNEIDYAAHSIEMGRTVSRSDLLSIGVVCPEPSKSGLRLAQDQESHMPDV